jgi:hypothetical protein
MAGEKNISSLSGIEQVMVVDLAPQSLYRLSYTAAPSFTVFEQLNKCCSIKKFTIIELDPNGLT